MTARMIRPGRTRRHRRSTVALAAMLLCTSAACGDGGDDGSGGLDDARRGTAPGGPASSHGSVPGSILPETTGVSCRPSRTDPALASIAYGKRTYGDRDGLVTYNMPEYQVEITTVGDLTLAGPSVATITALENSTDLHYELRNDGSTRLRVEIPWDEIYAARPPHANFFWHFIEGDEARGDRDITLILEPGETRRLRLFVSQDLDYNDGVLARPRRNETGELLIEVRSTIPMIARTSADEVRIDLDLRMDGHGGPGIDRAIRPTAAMAGVVLDSAGAPIQGALVTMSLANAEMSRFVRTDASGTFRLDVYSSPGLRDLLGDRPLEYDLTRWLMTVEAPGTHLVTIPGLEFAAGEVADCDIVLEPLATRDYRLAAELATEGPYGFWKLSFFGAGDRVVGIKGVHPPLQQATAHVVAMDLDGRELWRVPTDEECWGLSVHPSGDLIGVQCYDGIARVIDAQGRVVRTFRTGPGIDPNASEEIHFTADGRLLLVDMPEGMTAYDLRDWSVQWRMPERLQPYHACSTHDGTVVYVSGKDGQLMAIRTADGAVLWERVPGTIGALFLAVDAQGRVYAGGKTRSVHAYDPDGSLRWTHRTADTVNRASNCQGVSEDGGLMVLPTLNGLMEAFDVDGESRWQRWLPLVGEGTQFEVRVAGPGHQGVWVARDGSLALHGTRINQLVLLDGDGNLLWNSDIMRWRDGFWDGGGYHPSINSVLATEDGEVLIAGYSDSVIRVWRRTR